MTADPTKPPSLNIDLGAYGEFLEDSDLSDEQKLEFIQTLWSLVVNFVDLGLGCHPLQQACEQIAEKPPILPDDLVSSIMDLSENQQKQEQAEQGVVLLGAKEES
ncbi:MAG: hypothetical protein OIF58_15685 [Cohaesibacter sp.]|nr:hypothetical protein [Cohaesibacter sp.]